ncbi:hypothetical protein [Roseicyclus marinus]|uniref:Uncharacterized protein n=1 Tax=Roseicyclus marinus TaxID=2161673 RepID=A0AA48KH70_9RHOB|nr:hypothetical protein MACH21_05040 [Roseicyclus marinus]
MIDDFVGAEPSPLALKTAQIGRCGELLVQFLLLKLGVESAPMTTDSGVDLVAFLPESGQSITIQVKSNLQPKRNGKRGKLELVWALPKSCPAQFIALTDLSREKVWFFSKNEFAGVAQQETKQGLLRFYMHLEKRQRKTDRPADEHEFEGFLLENRPLPLLASQVTLSASETGSL